MQQVFEFSDFRFDLGAPLLMRGSQSIEVAPRALEILAVLVRNAGQVVRKDDLLSLVWPDTVVEEGNLAVHVSSLRKALGENASGGAYIETLPKRGYRFAAPVCRPPQIPAASPEDDASDLCRVAAHYLQHLTADGCRRAAVLYRQCIATDRHHAKARAGLAESLLMRFILGDLSRDEAVPGAAALLAEANRIDPSCIDVHLSLARLHSVCDWQWDRAEDRLRYALELASDSATQQVLRAWLASHLVRRGDLDRGLRELRYASSACSLSPVIWSLLADAHFLARDFAGCAAASREGLQLHPNHWVLYRALAKALTALGDHTGALRYFRRASLLNEGPKFGLLAEIAYVQATAGNRDNAVNLLARIRSRPGTQHVSLISIAMIHAALGSRHRALDCIDGACAGRDWGVSVLKRDSRLDPLRTAPQYRSVLVRVGI